MRTVVKVKQCQGRASSNAARYIAESKLEPEREGKGPRPLFANRGYDLTYGDANRYLNNGRGRPAKGDLIHFSVSFQNEDFEQLGASDEERKERLREAAREAMEEFRSDLRVSDWRWVAGIHLNTSYPHLHFLIFKEITSDKNKPRRLGRIPKRLLPYRELSSDGTITAAEGKLGARFVAALDRAHQRAITEREGQDMTQTILSNTLEFDSPLVHQGIEYRTVENFSQAMKTPKDDLETRRKIAAASPDEARALSEKLNVRPDWPEIRHQVLETAIRHKFTPGTKWHARLRATGDQDIIDGSKENHLGNLLMRLRDSREKIITSDEILLEANRRNLSLAGRELVQELILRSPAPDPVNPPEVLDNIREALKDRQLNDPYYNSQPEKADWLGEHSQELRDLYERGATIKDNVLVIPAEGHDLNDLNADREPFINEISYAHQEIKHDPERANEFYHLAKAIAGKTANASTERDYFRYFYDLIKHDGDGRYLKPEQKEARAWALEQTLAEMRLLAGEMEAQETLHSIEAHRPEAMLSLEQVREAILAASYEGDGAEDKIEQALPKKNISPVFNTSARKVNLSDEHLRFAPELTFEDRKSLVEVHLPNIDAKLESGRHRAAIFGEINQLVRDWNGNLPEDGAARQNDLLNKNYRIGSFLRAYTNERLKDPETRALNASEIFREAHEQITEARTPEELNKAARRALRGNNLDWRERALLFFGRAPDEHTAEMRELRQSWGLTRAERAKYVKELGEGRRAPSPALEKMLAELESRTSVRAISHYRASIINQEMRNPGKLDLHGMYERLHRYERDYLFGKIEEREKSLATRQPSLRETAPEIDVSRTPSIQVPRAGESFREYSAAVTEIEQRLLGEAIAQQQSADKGGNEITQAEGLLTREDKLRIRTIAANLAWERLEPQQILTNEPAVMEMLSLGEAIAKLRNETQPQTREAARRLDEFIRSRNLDQFAEKKTDYYYRGDQIPRDEVEKLSPADRRAFAALEAHAGATLAELKDGFRTIDRIRLEIDEARNGVDAAVKQAPAQIINRGSVEIQNKPLPERGANIDQERMNDRQLLGQVIIAHALADCAKLNYETARDHGHTFRFNIHDESLAANRRISDLDVHRRADARGNRAADECSIERYDDRRSIRGQVSEADIHYHSETLAEHGKKLDYLVNQLESKAKDALNAYQSARQLAGEVIEKYQKRGEPLPVPLVKRETLVKAQEEVIKLRFADHTEKLERLRVALAEEHGQPMRSDREAARLAAQVFTAGTELHAREERARRFDEISHLRQWEVRGEKFSLADIDRRVERLNDAAAVFGRYELHIDPGGRKASSAEIERLGMIRLEVIEKIGERQGEMRERVSEAGKLLDTLTRAYARESALRDRSGQSMPDPLFTREELERAADNIETARDATGLRQLSVFERQFNTYADPKERFEPAEGWGRAPARAIIAEVFHRESHERLAAFEQRGVVQPLLIETPDSRLITHRLQETQPRSLIEQIARPLVEMPQARELRQGVEQAFTQYANRLKADFERTSSYLEAAREIASAQAAERTLRAGQEVPEPEPALTPKQAMTIEIYAERQPHSAEREHLLSLARGSASSHYDTNSITHSPEPDAAREIAPAIGRGR